MEHKKKYCIKYHDVDLSKFNFLVTGGAGFIGSNIVEYLMENNAGFVRVLDNLSTGHKSNIECYFGRNNFDFLEGDIRFYDDCLKATQDIEYVFHEAALGSVPRSVADPITTNTVNIDGFLNMLVAIKENKKVKRIVYAASSSTYGDHEALPKIEERIGNPLSPYAVTKYVNELYANVFANTYGLETIGLRYFNVFGQRQDPNGSYAAVIPLFIKAIFKNEPLYINGDGNQSRDFTYIDNVIQANIKAMFVSKIEAINQVYNVAYGEMTTINEMIDTLAAIENISINKMYRESRVGDVKHSLADINKAASLLNYRPLYTFKEGLIESYKYYKNII
jgi:UDP-N-acetylglucosamine 4-epimerase